MSHQCIAAESWIYQHQNHLVAYTTRSIGTVHTSAKARLTSAAIWPVSMSSRVMSVR